MTLLMLNEEGGAQLVHRVPQGEARREHVLRDLIAEHPQILPVHDLDPSYGPLLTVTRELSVPGVGFVDILLMDASGRLVVVECKLWRNPQARREVVGQILDYAREFARWGYEDLQRQVSVATKRQGNVLYALACEAGGTLDEAAFVDRVTRDLAAGRFLLLVVGDGITEGTRRIGEYLAGQPGLAFTFGLIEIAQYRHADADGAERLMVQPRVLAQTALIERLVIRSEVAGVVIDAVVPTSASGAGGEGMEPRQPSGAGLAWRDFVARFLTQMRFDDPGQPPPRSGGTGWIRVPLPANLYVNLYRSSGNATIGAQVRFTGAEGVAAYAELLEEREAIDSEFAAAGLDLPSWSDGEVPLLSITTSSPLPWTDQAEEAHRAWMTRIANQYVNSLRPRLQRIAGDQAA
ncbi:hypothetical protein C1T17_13745 [Sphingobium sp. SCG-1]|uniref:hypothetical protein n=1 Tax=Sphingobium sp. SCG-1 TaxID=2072936 RepID=UPI000CD6881E|nr:hypothetical protein [Sphingobium sp. SCG-1]AUW58998.1 hypothetical protein C1T17_13745 [Sphingobium sp. SCG-1]